MKILMMTSPEVENSPFSMREKRFPLGLGILISVLRKAGHEVTFVDQYLQYNAPAVMGILNKYDWIGLYINTPCWEGAKKILELVHYCIAPETTKIMVGGPHCSVFPETIPDYVDKIVQGEGEEVICNLVEGKIAKRIIKAKRIRDLDSLPMPAYDIFNSMNYQTDVPWFEGKVFNMNTSRGCPYNCEFCSVKKIWGKEYTCMSAKRVIKDVKYLVKNFGIDGVYFREDNFTIKKSRVLEICAGLSKVKKRVSGIKWICETRVDTLTEELVKTMAASGCRAFYVGFESGSQRMLDILKKGITVEQSLQTAEWCHKYGIKLAASFIIKHPEETYEDTKASQILIEKMNPEVVWYNRYRKEG